ncbi:MAG: hypothetical protein HY716_14220 [Planctomycetes bacterium]|nr:hypothetical protein [Planctomycetota bacterium]
MKVFSHGTAVVILAVSFSLPSVQAQDKDKDALRYEFTKGDVQSYSVDLKLHMSMAGSDPVFTKDLGEPPFTMTLNGVVNNVVLKVNEADGTAELERRFLNMKLNGKFRDKTFSFSYDHEKDKNKRKTPDMSVERHFEDYCVDPLKFSVTSEGKYFVSDPDPMKQMNFNRFVTRAGAMYWPLAGKPVENDPIAWLTKEEIAIPALHDHIFVEIRNKKVKVITGKNLMVIEGEVRLREKKQAASEAAPIPGMDIKYNVQGKVTVEFDLTHKRLHSNHVQITITLDGQGVTPSGDPGPIKGKVQYEESQVWKDK